MTDFSRRTGDLEVMSKPDIHLLALTYELELERNGGDWRIRKDPGQKDLNGRPPSASTSRDVDAPASVEEAKAEVEADIDDQAPLPKQSDVTKSDSLLPAEDDPADPSTVAPVEPLETVDQVDGYVEAQLDSLHLGEPSIEESRQEDDGTGLPVAQDSDEDDSDGWITPSNLKAHQAKDAAVSGPKEAAIQETLQAALLTSDFAMQNVALRINLKYVSTSMLSHQAKFANHYPASFPHQASHASASSRHGSCAATDALPSRAKWTDNSVPNVARPRSRASRAALTPQGPPGYTSKRTLSTTSAATSTACQSPPTAAPTANWPTWWAVARVTGAPG